MRISKLEIQIEEIEKGGGIVTDNNRNNMIFHTVKEAEDYIYKMHPIWNDGLDKKEINQTFAIYDKKNPSKDLSIIKF